MTASSTKMLTAASSFRWQATISSVMPASAEISAEIGSDGFLNEEKAVPDASHPAIRQIVERHHSEFDDLAFASAETRGLRIEQDGGGVATDDRHVRKPRDRPAENAIVGRPAQCVGHRGLADGVLEQGYSKQSRRTVLTAALHATGRIGRAVSIIRRVSAPISLISCRSRREAANKSKGVRQKWRSLGNSENSPIRMGLPVFAIAIPPLKHNGYFCDWQTPRSDVGPLIKQLRQQEFQSGRRNHRCRHSVQVPIRLGEALCPGRSEHFPSHSLS
jgi:hypothetical protein